ncbi:MAG: YrzQ family protein [Bacillaceae bacterium]
MNKVVSSLIVIGAGVAAYQVAKKNDLLTEKNFKRAKRMMKMLM